MALPESREGTNKYPGVTAVGSKNLSQTPGLDTTDTEVADDPVDHAAIGPNNPQPTRGPGQPFDIILS